MGFIEQDGYSQDVGRGGGGGYHTEGYRQDRRDERRDGFHGSGGRQQREEGMGGGYRNNQGKRGGQDRRSAGGAGGGHRGDRDGGGARDRVVKHYRPKIKEDGFPPNYRVEDYQFMEPSMLNCGLCKKKNMWDGGSFLNHLLGGAHNKIVEEIIQEETEIVTEMREQLKIKAGEVTGDSQKCNMCNIRVKGGTDAMNSHRRTETHQKLKKFIHPHCVMCKADFELRSCWTYHMFSAEHLTNMAMAGKGADDGVLTLEQMKYVVRTIKEANNNKQSTNKDKDSSSSPSSGNKKKEKGDKRVDRKRKAEVKKDLDDDVIILDDDGMEEGNLQPVLKDVDLQNKEFKGSKYVKPVNGFYCKLCKKFFGPGKEVVKTHCASWNHLQNLKSVEDDDDDDFAESPEKKAK